MRIFPEEIPSSGETIIKALGRELNLLDMPKMSSAAVSMNLLILSHSPLEVGKFSLESVLDFFPIHHKSSETIDSSTTHPTAYP